MLVIYKLTFIALFHTLFDPCKPSTYLSSFINKLGKLDNYYI